MISKVINLRPQIKNWSRLLTTFRGAQFSATAPPADNAGQNIENLAPLDKQAKDEKFEDMTIKFEREWKKVYDERNTQYRIFLLAII